MISYYTKYLRENKGYRIYGICLFADPFGQNFRNIEAVEYVLHPTFPNPVRRVEDADTCFALETEGWGSFEMAGRIFLKDGSDSSFMQYIELGKNEWPLGSTLAEGSAEDFYIYKCLLDDPKWDWRKLRTILTRFRGTREEALRILESLQKRRLARKAPFPSLEGDELWGATARVGVLPHPVYPAS